jgi:hypothetical protein
LPELNLPEERRSRKQAACHVVLKAPDGSAILPAGVAPTIFR